VHPGTQPVGGGSLLTVFMILVIMGLYVVNRRLDVRAAREAALS